jgi:hypothetical protein
MYSSVTCSRRRVEPNPLRSDPSVSPRQHGQRLRRERERRELQSQHSLTRRQLGQRLRREREHRSSSHAGQERPSNRQLAQRRRRQRERAARSSRVSGSPVTFARSSYVEPVEPVSFGDQNVLCRYCSAFHWMDERLKDSPVSSPRFSKCCHHGRVYLEPFPDPPDDLLLLYTDGSPTARFFREHIRQYNAALAFTSFFANEQDLNSGGGGPWTWKSGYTIYHRAGGLIPRSPERVRSVPFYFPFSSTAMT